MTKFETHVLLLSAVLGGCSSTPIAPSPGKPEITAAAAPARNPAPAVAPSPSAVAPGSTRPLASATVNTAPLAPHLDPKSRIYTDRSVHFDFDMFTIKPEYMPLIERHGSYLAGMPTLAIKIEGNADERGSSEYNLALGQKRAQAVVQALKTYGASESQLEALSWGEERPKALGHDEAAWAENRRADLVYPRP